jgi:hypothetical protein
MKKDDAVNEALKDVEWSLDGLYDSPNLVVQLSAIAAAIPMSIYNQVLYGVRGVSSKTFEEADRQLGAALRQLQPQRQLVVEVAQQLAPRTAQPVVLADGTWPSVNERQPRAILCGARGELVSGRSNGPAGTYVFAQAPDVALEIQVLNAALKGKGGANPKLALCLEGRATLVRVSDGAKLHSTVINYKGGGHTFAKWAADDARLFRQEMEKAYREFSGSVVEQLAARQLIVPAAAGNVFLAGGANPR